MKATSALVLKRLNAFLTSGPPEETVSASSSKVAKKATQLQETGMVLVSLSLMTATMASSPSSVQLTARTAP